MISVAFRQKIRVTSTTFFSKLMSSRSYSNKRIDSEGDEEPAPTRKSLAKIAAVAKEKVVDWQMSQGKKGITKLEPDVLPKTAVSESETLYESHLERSPIWKKRKRLPPSQILMLLAEEQISEGIQKGFFDDLKGAGKPLTPDDLSPPGKGDITERLINRMVNNQGFLPEWVESEKEIASDIAALRKKLLTQFGSTLKNSDNVIDVMAESDKKYYIGTIEDINRLIDRLNLIVPLLHLQRAHVTLERELSRIKIAKCFKYIMAFSEPVDIPGSKAKGSSSIPVAMVDGRFSTEGGVNPDPLPHDPMQDLMLEEYLSPRRLRELTGVDNLDEVEYLELRVNTSETTLGNFGVLVPNLKHLKLTGSSIQSVRDLGSSLDNLQTLWMATTGLQDIDGLSSMCNLRELYLAFNDISDLSPCSMLDDLRILDLEGNQLEDICQIEFLALCTKLADLTLRGNPFCEKMTHDEYRKTVFKILPNLKHLDDKNMSCSDRSDRSAKASSMPVRSPVPPKPNPVPLVSSSEPQTKKEQTVSSKPPHANSASNPFSDDWNLINQFVREGTIGTESVLTDSGYSSLTSPATTAAANATSGRSATARPRSSRPVTAAASPFRPLTSLATTSTSRLGSSGSSRPTTSLANASPSPSMVDDADESSSSLLTTGPVICGNPSRALRRRREFATSAVYSRENTASTRSSSTASPNNDALSSPALRTVIGPENVALAAAADRNNNNSRSVASVASLGESSDRRDVGSLLQDVDKWRSDYQIGAAARKRDNKPDVLVVEQGVTGDDDDSGDELALTYSDDEDGITQPISPRPPSGPKPAATRRSHNFVLEKPSGGDRSMQAAPAILAPPLPLPAIGSTLRPMTSSQTTSSSSRMSSKIQYVSAKPSH